MSDQWDEQDAFKTNKFEVGDRVRIYHRFYDDNSKGEPLPLEQDLLSVDNVWVQTTNTHYYHFKQCRLLKKREPREWLGFACTKNFGRFSYLRSCKECDGECESIKVREVLDE